MSAIFSSVVATFITVPLLGYILVFVISKQLTKHHRKSVLIALDVTTFFIILAVHYLLLVIWEKSFLWLIIIFIILTAIMFVILHWKTKKEINIPLVFKGIWRFNFLIFMSAYIFLLLYGLIKRVTSFVS
jgi:Ca2+/Na+ antiporter